MGKDRFVSAEDVLKTVEKERAVLVWFLSFKSPFTKGRTAMSTAYRSNGRKARRGKRLGRKRSSREPAALRVGPHEIRAAGQGDMVRVELPADLLEAIALCKVSLEEVIYRMGITLAEHLLEDEVEKLAGKYHERIAERQWYRWGHEQGYVIMGGQKVPILRPRVRSQDGQEAELQRYEALQSDGARQRAVLKRVLAGVSSRKYEQAVEAFCDSYGIAKSSVSQTFIRASKQALKELCERELSELDLVGIIIDGIEFRGHLVVVSVGVDSSGRKHILGLWEGATENAEVCTALLQDIVARGVRTDREYLFVIDGSKALRKAIRKVFSELAHVQRCLVHEKRNVLEHLPPQYHREVSRMLSAAWNMTGYAEARKALIDVVAYLRRINPSAARSLEEGMENSLTLHKLGVPESLRRSFQTTNIIESCFSVVRNHLRRVKRWRRGDMVTRWLATALLEVEKRFRKIRGYREMAKLTLSLQSQSKKESGHIAQGA